MSIIKTTFTGSTLNAQKTEVLNYLQANAADYFDEITADSNGNISCMVGETTALLIGMDGATQRKVTLANGSYIAVGSAQDTNWSTLFRYGKKTSKGVMLITAAGTKQGATTGPIILFITKNETGDTCILGTMPKDAYNTPTTYFGADIKNDASIYAYISEVAWSARSQLSRSAPVTALTPAIFSGSHYAPNVFLATFNQFSLTEADLSINGVSYATDGVMALQD